MPDSLRVGAYTASDNALHRRGSGHVRLGNYRDNWLYLFINFCLCSGKFDICVLTQLTFHLDIEPQLPIHAVHQFNTKTHDCIIWYTICIAHVFTLTVYNIWWIWFRHIYSSWGSLMDFSGDIWYEKLPQKWVIWQKCRVKSPIIPDYPCTRVVGFITFIVSGMQMHNQIVHYNTYYVMLWLIYIATYYRM